MPNIRTIAEIPSVEVTVDELLDLVRASKVAIERNGLIVRPILKTETAAKLRTLDGCELHVPI